MKPFELCPECTETQENHILTEDEIPHHLFAINCTTGVILNE